MLFLGSESAQKQHKTPLVPIQPISPMSGKTAPPGYAMACQKLMGQEVAACLVWHAWAAAAEDSVLCQNHHHP